MKCIYVQKYFMFYYVTTSLCRDLWMVTTTKIFSRTMAVCISWFNILFFRDFSDYKIFRNILLKCAAVGWTSQVNTILNYEIG